MAEERRRLAIPPKIVEGKEKRKTPFGNPVKVPKRMVKPGIEKDTGIVKPLAEMTPKQRTSELTRIKEQQEEPSSSPKQQLKKKPKALPKAGPKPTVGRGESGRIVSLKKQPTISKRKETRTGKKIDRATGKIAVPLVKRDESGRAVGTTPEERKATITTILPAAGPEVMQQPTRTQTAQPIGVLRRGGQKLRGFKGSYEKVHAGVQAALGHIESMKATQGTPEFDHHQDAFNAIHSNIKAWDERGLGITVGQLKHSTLHGASPAVLSLLHTKIKDRLEDGKTVHEENIRRAQEGRERKATQQ